MNADTYQQGWIEWKTKSNGKKACRFRYWVRDESKPGGWGKAATPWEEGLTAKQAKTRLRDLMTAMAQEAPKAPPVAVAKKGLTLQEFVESHWADYQSNRGIKESTRGSNAASLKNHIFPVLGSMEMGDVSPTHISNFFRDLADKHLSTKSVLNIYQLLHVMFEVAAEHDLVESNPVRRKLHRPQYRHKKMPIWSAENVQKILQEVPARWKVLFWCIALTGVRVGELLALQWKDIDWDAKTMTFGKGFWRGRLQDSTKTGQEHVRHMPGSLDRILVKHLEGSRISDPMISCFADPMTILVHMTLMI